MAPLQRGHMPLSLAARHYIKRLVMQSLHVVNTPEPEDTAGGDKRAKREMDARPAQFRAALLPPAIGLLTRFFRDKSIILSREYMIILTQRFILQSCAMFDI